MVKFVIQPNQTCYQFCLLSRPILYLLYTDLDYKLCYASVFVRIHNASSVSLNGVQICGWNQNTCCLNYM